VLRLLTPDYGVDSEVDVFENVKTTGITFKLDAQSR